MKATLSEKGAELRELQQRQSELALEIEDISNTQGWTRKILVDSDILAHPQSSMGSFNHAVQTYRFHQYVVFVDHDGEIKFAKRQIGDNSWNIYPTGIVQEINDSHLAPHFSFDKYGYIIFFYNTYGGAGPPRWRISTYPEDPSSWGNEIIGLSGSDDKAVSYPVMIRFFNEEQTLLLLYREDKPAGPTSRYHLDKWNPDTKTWTSLHHPLVSPPQPDNGWAYFAETKQVDKQNRLHLFLIWRWTATGDNDDNRNICYMMTDDFGQTWKASNGIMYDLPVTFETAEIVDEVPVGSGLLPPDASFDEEDYPVVLYTKNDVSGIQQYFIAYLQNGNWIKEQISQKTSRGHLNIPRNLRWRITPVAYRLLVSTTGDLYAFVADSEYGDGLTLFFKKKGSQSWQKYSFISDALIESPFQIDIWKWNYWGNWNILDILAIEGASYFDNRGLKAEAPLYLYEFHLPFLGIEEPFKLQEERETESHEILIKSSIDASSKTSLVDCSRIIQAGSIMLTVSASYNSLATQGIKVHIYTSYDGTNYDTEEQTDTLGNPLFGDMPFSAGQSVQKTKDISTDATYIKVTIDNQDRDYAVSNVKVIATSN